MRSKFVRGATLRQEESTAFSDVETKKQRPKKKTGVQLRYIYSEEGGVCACGGRIGTIGYSVEPGKIICYACATPYRVEDDKTKKNNLYKHFEEMI